ncbi:calcium-binding protein, partial [Paracoccus sp. (in: a-proteobacteria)]|uniref:calcium-binding protein n=1 Tax=Paracoccus sp. TaxID=267 RepID=UPI00396C90D8
AFRETLKEIDFSNFRYPGGGVTEDQTWANGGLDRMFGKPLEPGGDGYVMTINEALDFASTTGKGLTLVTPTFQFFDKGTGSFDYLNFDQYIVNLEASLQAYPDVRITAFEIGNEYWGSKNWGSLSAHEYGMIADAQIPRINEMIDRLSQDMAGWTRPAIGIQAGVDWRAEQNPDGTWTAVGPKESLDIISEISLEHREMVTTIFQHSYPHADTIAQNLNWALRPMEVFKQAEGFGSDLRFTLSEFNIGASSAIGIDQGAAWIDAFSRAVDLGVDAIDHWGIAYDWLSNKFYDTRFLAAESDGGKIVTIATPMGQIYDIAQSHLVGKSTMTDAAALEAIQATDGIGVTGFADDSQQIIFLHNATDQSGMIDLAGIPEGMHVSLRYLTPANSPHSSWYDESLREVARPGDIADARGDMKVISGPGVQNQNTLQPGEMLVVIISDPARDLVIEGAHNVTDPHTGMVDDLIVGADGNDILRGHVGNDTIEGGGGRNVISGGKGDDRLVASDGGDVIFADGGSDTVIGGDGDDLIFSGAADGEEAGGVLSGGDGRDLFLIGAGSNASIRDLSDQDHLGFAGAFADVAALRNASHVDGNDLVIEMPDGRQIVLSGAADRIDSLHEQVLDFMEPQQILKITDGYLADLSLAQLVELFEQKEASFQQASGMEDQLYFDTLETTLARLELDRGLQNDTEGDEGRPDIPDEDEEDALAGDEDPDEDLPPDPYDGDDHSNVSGGSCFVATAAYGDAQHPDVVALRTFRDAHLVRYRSGRAFIRLYWIVGPRLASVTYPDQIHARLARLLLSRIVRVLMHLKLVARD